MCVNGDIAAIAANTPRSKSHPDRPASPWGERVSHALGRASIAI